MDLDGILQMIDARLRSLNQETLNDNEQDLFRGLWEGKSYKDIYRERFRDEERCTLNHMQSNIANKVWTKLRPITSEDLKKSNVRSRVQQALVRWQQEELERSTAAERNSVELKEFTPRGESRNLVLPSAPQSPVSKGDESSGITAYFADACIPASSIIDWGESPDIENFCGRDGVLSLGEQQIGMDYCQLLAIVGEAGIGKTWFAKQLALRLRGHYDRLVWRSLSSSPPLPLNALLVELLQVLTGEPPRASVSVADFIEFLMNRPSLIILDQFENLLQASVHDGSYQQGYDDYGELLTQLGQRAHQSCVVIISREHPKQIEETQGQCLVRECHLPAMDVEDVKALLRDQGYDDIPQAVWRQLSQRCDGNPRALLESAKLINSVYGGKVEAFCQYGGQLSGSLLNGQRLQYQRLSSLEQEILVQLVQQDEIGPTFKVLLEMLPPDGLPSRQEALISLLRRSLLQVSRENPDGHSVKALMTQYIHQEILEDR